MTHWLRKRSLPVRILVYLVAAAFAFAVAAGVGAAGALMLRGDLGLPGDLAPSGREEPPPSDEQENAARQQEEGGAVQQVEAAPHQSEAEYTGEVGEIQAKSVKVFSDSHDKLLRYDALTAADVEKMQTNVAALRWFTIQVGELDPPQRYGEQYKVFRSAIDELYEAARLAYTLAADPTAATQSEFDAYDSLVNEAAADLRRSNEMLERDYRTIEGVQRVSPLS